jgi:hypothetical protein
MIFAIAAPRFRSIKENIIKWWYKNTNIFDFTFKIGILDFWINIQIFTFTLEYKIEFTVPQLRNFYFKNIYRNFIELTKHKVAGIEFIFTNELVTGITFYENIHCSHASINLEISILGFTIIFYIQDRRHWDDEKNKVED